MMRWMDSITMFLRCSLRYEKGSEGKEGTRALEQFDLQKSESDHLKRIPRDAPQVDHCIWYHAPTRNLVLMNPNYVEPTLRPTFIT